MKKKNWLVLSIVMLLFCLLVSCASSKYHTTKYKKPQKYKPVTGCGCGR